MVSVGLENKGRMATVGFETKGRMVKRKQVERKKNDTRNIRKPD